MSPREIHQLKIRFTMFLKINIQVTLRVTLKTDSQMGVNSNTSEYSIQYLYSI